MNTRSILILTAILLFGVLVTTGLVLKSTSDTKTDSSKVTEGAAEGGAKINGTELGANSIKLAPASQDKPPTVNVKKSDLKPKIGPYKLRPLNKPAPGEELDPSEFKQAISEVAAGVERDPNGFHGEARGVFTMKLNGFFEKDPEGLISVVKQLPAGIVRDEAMKFLVSSLASRDPAMASALLDQVPPQDLLYESGVIGRVWALCDPKAALAFANQQSDPVVKSSLLSEVIGSMALTDPQGALPLARAAVSSALSLPPGESELDKQDMKALLSRAANLIYVLDPQGALATYQSLPVGEARDAFAKNIHSHPTGA